MSQPVLSVKGLGKRYRIGQSRPPLVGAWSKVKATVGSPFSWLAEQIREPREDEILWSLKDVSFDVMQGDVVGIIGANGAGKSTLLKILSRITEPTCGQARIRGRVGALLEVGTGMHPDLTGRENIYQNGCLLGMTKREIDQSFDEIVSFSGVEKFIDTPVKRYSSGMRVRLGFAIAAHLEPEVLIVDEVLAVGDSQFQQRCLGKMKDIAGHGRTVLFVSHQMAAVESLCSRAIVLEEGGIAHDGDIVSAIKCYNNRFDKLSTLSLRERKDRGGRGQIRFSAVELLDKAGSAVSSVEPGDPLTVRIYFEKHTSTRLEGRVILGLCGTIGCLFECSSEVTLARNVVFDGGGYIECYFQSLPLANGDYWINLYMEAGGDPQDNLLRAIMLQVSGKSFFGSGRDCPVEHRGRYVMVPHQFSEYVSLEAGS